MFLIIFWVLAFSLCYFYNILYILSIKCSNFYYHSGLPQRQESQENQEKSGKTNKNDKSPEKSGENGGFRKKVMKSQEIWYKYAVNKKWVCRSWLK